MDRAKITEPGLGAKERAKRILSVDDIYGLDRRDTAEQRAGLLRCRIVDAIEAAMKDARIEAFSLAREVYVREARPTLVLGELIAEELRNRGKLEGKS